MGNAMGGLFVSRESDEMGGTARGTLSVDSVRRSLGRSTSAPEMAEAEKKRSVEVGRVIPAATS
ncbi:hypothetical protein LTR08_000972 [Meristemomyces frigidus]|nr:hypothetical protein LTR08_000972 [Meristemomyces frigidus]